MDIVIMLQREGENKEALIGFQLKIRDATDYILLLDNGLDSPKAVNVVVLFIYYEYPYSLEILFSSAKLTTEHE